MSRLPLVLVLLVLACEPAADAPTREAPPAPEGALEAAAPAAEAADDRPAVVFLGTSLTAGLGLERADQTYVARLEQMADSAGLPIRAQNAGVSGETSAGGLRRLDWILREPVDVLVLELGANDGLRGQDPAALARNLSEIVDRTRTRYPGVSIVIAGMEAPPNLGDRYTTRFREVFGEVARAKGASLVPFLLEGVAGVPELNQADGIHPTPEGHLRMAETLWPVLQGVLRTRAEAAGR